MARLTKPRVFCGVANTYAGPQERIVEFSNGGTGGQLLGGLIQFIKTTTPDGSPGLTVSVYRQDPEVRVEVQGRPFPEWYPKALIVLTTAQAQLTGGSETLFTRQLEEVIQELHRALRDAEEG